jgi:hypothetical protein
MRKLTVAYITAAIVGGFVVVGLSNAQQGAPITPAPPVPVAAAPAQTPAVHLIQDYLASPSKATRGTPSVRPI